MHILFMCFWLFNYLNKDVYMWYQHRKILYRKTILFYLVYNVGYYILGEGNWNLRPLGFDEGSLHPNMLHSSLCFLLLLLVGWFRAWTTCDWEHQLRGRRCYNLVVVRSHHHNCGSEFTGGGRQCWFLFSDAIHQEQSNTIVND
jgi:hypothetical protein